MGPYLDVVAAFLAIVALVLAAASLLDSRQTRRSTAPARFRELEGEARELISEFAGEYDKLHMMLARNAKRAARAAEPEVPAAATIGVTDLPLVDERADWKARVRAQNGWVPGAKRR